jgi:hypothetical protein
VQDAVTGRPAGSTIVVCPGIYSTNATFNKNMTLVGAGRGMDPSTATILDGGRRGAVLEIFYERSVAVRNLTVTRGHQTAGGGITNWGRLELERVDIIDNTASEGGGGIHNTTFSVTLTDCLLRDNVSIGNRCGGAIFNGSFFSQALTTITMIRTVIEENTGPFGGGICNAWPGRVNVTEDSHIRNNTARVPSVGGGGIFNYGIVVVSGGSTITGNTPDNCRNFQSGAGCPAGRDR